MTPIPDAARLYQIIAATWPAAQTARVGPWNIRDGQGGGSRVSAATVESEFAPADLADAENAMRDLAQRPLFMIRDGDEALDAFLADQGYIIKDPVVMYASTLSQLTERRPPPVTAFTVWPPLASQAEIWVDGGIGTERLAVMERAPHPKTTFLGRLNDSPAGTVFLGCSDSCAMIHALEVASAHRRFGLANILTRAGALWAQDQGMDWLTLVTTVENVAANSLYSSLGMSVVGHYHYRILP